MSLPASSIGSAGVPAVNQALQPAWVRNGSASTQKAYRTALAFEQTLVEQLARSLTATSGLTGESSLQGEGGEGGEAGSEAQSGELSSMLPQALAAGVMNAGGLGLAAQLTHSLQGVAGANARATTQAGATPGTGATSGTGATPGTPGTDGAPATGPAGGVTGPDTSGGTPDAGGDS